MEMTIKTDWSEVNLSEFIEISKVEVDESLVSRPIAKMVKMCSILSNVDESDILNATSEVLNDLFTKVNFVIEQPEISLATSFEIDGVEYTYTDYNSLTAGEMIGIEQLLIEGQSSGRNTLPEQLAILVRPAERVIDPVDNSKTIVRVKKFDSDEMNARAELFMDKLTVPFFMGLLLESINGVKMLK